MNQLCRVCGEPAAGFHFGAFTCEGCKSFFGRTCNSVSSLGDCKNGGNCTITRKNRTACKSCRLRKCLRVGMSKSGSRYGRRSNWFKIHCLLQDQPNQSCSSLSIEKTKKILEEIQTVKLRSTEKGNEKEIKEEKGEEQPEECGRSEGSCSSSPTVSSSDAKSSKPESDEGKRINSPFGWFNQRGSIPPEALPLLAALTPFVCNAGLGIHANSTSSQLPGFSQYYPYFLSLLSNSSTVSSIADGSLFPSYPLSVDCRDSLEEERERKSHSLHDEQIGEMLKFVPHLIYQPVMKREINDSDSLINLRAGETSTEENKQMDRETRSEHSTKDGSDRTRVPELLQIKAWQDGVIKTVPTRNCEREQEIPNLIDQVKRNLTAETFPISNKRRRSTDFSPNLRSENLDQELKKKASRKQTNESNKFLVLDDRDNLHGNKSVEQKSLEQNEPIDLSIKTCSVSPGNRSVTPKQDSSICSRVLACSMTLTPIASYRQSPHSNSEHEDRTVEHIEERNSSAAIDLSCRV